MGAKSVVEPPLVLKVLPLRERTEEKDANAYAKLQASIASRGRSKDTVEEPFYDPARDGVTYSLLQGWQNCRESTRLSLQGWTPKQASFSTSFGGAMHWMLQHIYGDVQRKRLTKPPGATYLDRRLSELQKLWLQENPFAGEKDRADAERTWALLAAILPLYCQHWHEDFTKVEWTRVESEFRIPVEVTRHGRVWRTFFRGKIDGGFFNQKGRSVVFETKTKSRMDEGNLVDILPYELQINMYTSAVWHQDRKMPASVLYNVIRRPGLRQGQNETYESFLARLTSDIKARPDFYFVRMDMKVEPAELERFRMELGDLIADFLDWWYGYVGHYRNSGQCENKYGTCWALPICGHGSYDTVFMRKTVFRELEGD